MTITESSTHDKKHGGRIRTTLIVSLSIILVFFHLYTSAFGSLPDLIQRSLHVGGTLMLAFCLYGLRRPMTRDEPMAWYDLISIAIVFAFTANILIGYDRIMDFVFEMTDLDFIFGILAVALILEGCRRVIGWTIPILGLLGLGYALGGPYLPDSLAHRGLDPRFAIEVLYMSTRGLYGMVTGISATVISIFVIFGAMLLRTGAGQTFMDLATVLGGRSVGGGAKVATISSALFGSVSGSAAANVATTGAFTIPLMKRLGYRPEFAAAVESVASTGGQIMPPVMGAGAFIMAELLGISYFSIMIAAIIPALLYFLGCLAGIHFEASRLGYKPVASELLPKIREVLTIRRAGPVFTSMFLLVALLINGYSAGMAAFWATMVLIVLYVLGTRSLSDFKDRMHNLYLGFIDAGIGLVAISVLIAGAQILLAMISTTGLGVTFTSGIISLGESHLLMSLLLAMLVAMILGTGLPTAAAYLLAAAVVAPALIKLGVEPISAHMFIFYFSIMAGLTPPLCATVFIGASMAQAKWFDTSLVAMRLALVAFLVPYAFIYHPEILLIGDTWHIILYSCAVTLSVIAIAGSMAGFFITNLNKSERLILGISAAALVGPGFQIPLIGAVLLVFSFLWIKRKSLRETASVSY